MNTVKRVLTSDGHGEEGGGVFPGDGGITADERNSAQEVINEIEGSDGRQVPAQLRHQQKLPTL